MRAFFFGSDTISGFNVVYNISIAVFSLRKTKSAKNLGAKIFLQKKDAKKQKKSDHLKVHFYCKMLCYFSVLSLFPLIFYPR